MNVPSIPGSSSSRRTWKYEVFLSFRGEDTRNNFTGHLFAALQRKGIFTFKDDKRLRKGEPIGRGLLTAIQQSRISMVVLSKNYAASTWCLDELANISELIGQPGYAVLPIFYDVDPSVGRKQSGDYKNSFNEHEKNSSLDKVQRWRLALTKLADLGGYDVRNRSEPDIIDEVVKEAISRLGHRFYSLADDLIGMQPRAEAFEKFLDLESDEVRSVGIWGMPGVGKTALAAVVYDRISHQFDASCLLLDVSRVHKGPGLVTLQKQLLFEVLGENLEIWEEHKIANLIRTRLRQSKTLVVVDNVDHVEQLEKLVGKPEWFGKGSRIIITSRPEHMHILKVHGVNEVYKVEELNDDEAVQLLCRRAFKRDDPLNNDFKELTHSVLQYAEALPLAIRVLGSSLFEREQSEWEAQLDRLKENPNKDVMGVLETSLVSLEQKDKDIFVDVACFFKGEDENYATKILDHCGFSPAIGISNLCERSLIYIVNGKLWMHDLLQELGRKIAKGEFPDEPAKWSRLWLFKDLEAVNTGTEKVEAIVLNQEDEQEKPLKAEALSQMKRLRLIIFPDVKFSGSLNNFSSELRFLQWHKFPFSQLPSSFEPARLVELIMPDSNIRLLWEGIKTLPKLRSIDLSGSKNLIETPDLKGVKNLEKLDLEECTGLLKVDPSIGDLEKLTFLNLRNCDNLTSIPTTLFLLTSLETLNLSGCAKLAIHLNFEGPR